MEKINKLTLYKSNVNKNYSHEWAAITEEGNLRLDGYDFGPVVEAFWNSDDYEYWLTVDKDWKDTLLLLVIKERFLTLGGLRHWLDEKNFPHTFDNWV